jgi:predicted nuclease of restriction endonuclease-like (RecB) superfamily
MNYYNEIKENLINNEVYKAVKDYSKNKSDLETYYKVGKLLSEAGKHYGEGIIKEYSIKLSEELNKGYSVTSLKYMRKFYEISKSQPMAGQLSWSHYIELMKIKNINELNYYINQCILFNLSRNDLRTKIKSHEYERLPEETKTKLIKQEQPNIKDLVPSPIIIKNKKNIEIMNEKLLHQLILENILDFMNQLGNGYCLVGSEYKIKVGDQYNYLDLLLFNIEFNCYVVIELKVTELKKEHIGQVEVYMNYIDKNIKKFNHDKTIGIVIVKKNNKFVMEYCSDQRIIAREYIINNCNICLVLSNVLT